MLFRKIVFVGLCWGLVACGGDRRTQEGRALYADNCAICHGADKRGGGGAGVVGLSKTPADLTVLSAQNAGEFPLASVIHILDGYTNGVQTGRRMHAFTDLQSDKSRRLRTPEGRVSVSAPQAALIAYLQQHQRALPADPF
ncbi:MAG: cytochrome c [Roseobacter sp.]